MHPDEVVVCANVQGFKALCAWMSWLAESDPAEFFHFHLLWHLESEASIFEGEYPKNVWVLHAPKSHQVVEVPPEGTQTIPFELTFQVVSEAVLDEFAQAQATGRIPNRHLKPSASGAGDCG